ncbi:MULTISPECIES: hypothetical protein [Methylosinus]|nr:MULTISPECIES: hypothetical protein [Methylosinus]
MAETANFALRMPPKFKEAAVALSKTYVQKWKTVDGELVTDRSIGGGSINDVIVDLMRAGLSDAQSHLERDLAIVSDEFGAWSEIMTFFLRNPVAQDATSSNFPPDSKARKLIEIDEDDPNIDRKTAAEYYAMTQRRIIEMTEAKGFIQRALALD